MESPAPHCNRTGGLWRGECIKHAKWCRHSSLTPRQAGTVHRMYSQQILYKYRKNSFSIFNLVWPTIFPFPSQASPPLSNKSRITNLACRQIKLTVVVIPICHTQKDVALGVPYNELDICNIILAVRWVIFELIWIVKILYSLVQHWSSWLRLEGGKTV